MVAERAIARSISRPVREQIIRGRGCGRVLARFEHACDVVTRRGSVIAVATGRVGDGPLNIVLSAEESPFAGVEAGAQVLWDRGLLWLDGMEIDVREAAVWEPRVDWGALRHQRATISSSLASPASLFRAHTSGSVFSTFLGADGPTDPFGRAVLNRARDALEDLRDGWDGSLPALLRGGGELAGLGSGLTPAGDDFLVGLMLWAWLAHPAPRPFCQVLSEAAASRTTVLSTAFLRAAAWGLCSAPWHYLLAALGKGPKADIPSALRAVAGCGATSGADALCGFLFLSLRQPVAAHLPQ
ncbi:MAG: DUF2877 domain-containing protein [Anaerolineae bacterium]|nr:DUF2877 domain-containing protein [Anaerolineae bacterium]